VPAARVISGWLAVCGWEEGGDRCTVRASAGGGGAAAHDARPHSGGIAVDVAGCARSEESEIVHAERNAYGEEVPRLFHSSGFSVLLSRRPRTLMLSVVSWTSSVSYRSVVLVRLAEREFVCMIQRRVSRLTFWCAQVDFVTNATIAAAWDVAQLDNKSAFRIYHSTSSCLNPVWHRGDASGALGESNLSCSSCVQSFC